MGYKASIITIQTPTIILPDSELLSLLGFNNFDYVDDTTIEDAICPRDKSINIGYFNNCIIICDDYLLTRKLEADHELKDLISYEIALCDHFPESEILSVACHSVTDYHIYSLVKNRKKIRFKKAVDGEISGYGDCIKEEQILYGQSKMVDGERMFKRLFSADIMFEDTESMLMEDFTFGVAQRHLGVNMYRDNVDEINQIVLRKYMETTKFLPANLFKNDSLG